jgi:hypothetical protein
MCVRVWCTQSSHSMAEQRVGALHVVQVGSLWGDFSEPQVSCQAQMIYNAGHVTAARLTGVLHLSPGCATRERGWGKCVDCALRPCCAPMFSALLTGC